ncbi:uncharacterized protein LOC144160789 [Haemaphysalis longicornis]
MKSAADGKELRSGTVVGATAPDTAFSEALTTVAGLCQALTQHLGTLQDPAPRLQPDIPTYRGYDDRLSVADFLDKLDVYKAAVGASDTHMLTRVLPLVFQGPAACWWRLQSPFASWATFVYAPPPTPSQSLEPSCAWNGPGAFQSWAPQSATHRALDPGEFAPRRRPQNRYRDRTPANAGYGAVGHPVPANVGYGAVGRPVPHEDEPKTNVVRTQPGPSAGARHRGQISAFGKLHVPASLKPGSESQRANTPEDVSEQQSGPPLPPSATRTLGSAPGFTAPPVPVTVPSSTTYGRGGHVDGAVTFGPPGGLALSPRVVRPASSARRHAAHLRPGPLSGAHNRRTSPRKNWLRCVKCAKCRKSAGVTTVPGLSTESVQEPCAPTARRATTARTPWKKPWQCCGGCAQTSGAKQWTQSWTPRTVCKRVSDIFFSPFSFGFFFSLFV